jgi:hypothetical protein
MHPAWALEKTPPSGRAPLDPPGLSLAPPSIALHNNVLMIACRASCMADWHVECLTCVRYATA